MRDPFQNKTSSNFKQKLLALDAIFDSFFYQLRGSLSNGMDHANNFMRRFRVTGFAYWLFQGLSGGLNMAVFGAFLALALALSSFDYTANGLTTQTDYAVTFLDRYGNEIGKRGILQDDSFELDELPDHVIKAVLATEDRRFFEHFGIDFFGLARAIVENARAGGVVQGGSTLTQQLAKNLFLTNERTLTRKIDEAFLSLWLEANLTKREILKLYLDKAYMGAGTFGIAAASEYYFGKSAKDLSLAEAAMLAGLFKAPTKYAPHINLPAARARAKEVLINMVQAGFMTEGQIVAALRNPATPIDQSEIYTPNYFLDWAFEEVKRIAGSKYRVLTVKTTIDVNLQKQTEQAVESNLRQYGKQKRVNEAAAVLMEPTGAVVAIVGGRDYGKSQFNRATDAKRQPGSSFKPFVYTTAMMNGYKPGSVLQDAPITIGNWSPKNYGRSYAGPVTLTNALRRSINTIPVRLAQAMGRDKIVETAYKMGVKSELLITRSLPLGAAEVTVMDMATGYSVFASGGKKVDAHAILQIVNSKGKVIYDRRKLDPPEQIIPQKAIANMNKMMVTVVEAGTGRRAALPGIRAAGKTGTTSAYKDAWFVGYTGNYTAAVWYGNDSSRATNRLTGGNLPAMTWNAIMTAAHDRVDIKPIPFLSPLPGQPVNVQVAQGGRIKDLKAKRGLQRLSPQTVEALGDLGNLLDVPASNRPGSVQSKAREHSPIRGLTEMKKPAGKGLVEVTMLR
ncbi:transglycosylase domain-containing protein [Cohaesibacter gelatinilyticus]|uniref:Penicillin-binding protein 1A n=1 Tax=Cohaesibacter gelatinilyticus TaxID=372072 RepID=A0A285NDY9_9HYPH|nr:PBP1A family penicillin-binding protein [Cohaesibacter gelatinilyticus]SNZ07113.1 penicillin-binding protein 1A [Cohaesibacter gelatinilyticus]